VLDATIQGGPPGGHEQDRGERRRRDGETQGDGPRAVEQPDQPRTCAAGVEAGDEADRGEKGAADVSDGREPSGPYSKCLNSPQACSIGTLRWRTTKMPRLFS